MSEENNNLGITKFNSSQPESNPKLRSPDPNKEINFEKVDYKEIAKGLRKLNSGANYVEKEPLWEKISKFSKKKKKKEEEQIKVETEVNNQNKADNNQEQEKKYDFNFKENFSNFVDYCKSYIPSKKNQNDENTNSNKIKYAIIGGVFAGITLTESVFMYNHFEKKYLQEIKTQNQVISEFRENLGLQSQMNDSLRSQREKLENQIEAIKKQNSNLVSQKKTLEDTINDFENQLADLEDKNLEYLAEIQNYKTQIDDLKNANSQKTIPKRSKERTNKPDKPQKMTKSFKYNLYNVDYDGKFVCKEEGKCPELNKLKDLMKDYQFVNNSVFDGILYRISGNDINFGGDNSNGNQTKISMSKGNKEIGYIILNIKENK